MMSHCGIVLFFDAHCSSTMQSQSMMGRCSLWSVNEVGVIVDSRDQSRFLGDAQLYLIVNDKVDHNDHIFSSSSFHPPI